MVVKLQFFGGRGASSGVSERGNPYGSQYHAVLEHKNIKFVTNSIKNYEPLLETMTNGRTYVQVGGNDIVRIAFMDGDNKRYKVIEKDKKKGKWHVHHGYFHTEESEKIHGELNQHDKDFLDKISRIWHNRSR